MFSFSYKTHLFLFLSSLAATLVLTPLVRRLALRLRIVDNPSPRKIHKRPVPSLGGLSVFLTFVAYIGACFLFENRITMQFLEKRQDVLVILSLGAVALLLGVYDDARGAGAKTKFSVQIAAAILAYTLGFKIEGVSLGPFGSLNLGLLALPFTVFWIVGITNAINIIDGIDGLAAGVTLFVCAGNFFVSLVFGNVVMSVISAVLAGALLGFLRYNFPPAKIFLGNTGSLFLGMVVALVSIVSAQKSSTMVMMLIPIAVLGLPILDTALAIFRRSLLGRPIFVSDQGHIHHALLRLGFSEKKAVLFLYSFCILLLGFAAIVVLDKSREALVYLCVIGLISIVGIRILGYLNYEKLRAALCNRWRFRAKDAFSRFVLLKMKNVQTVDQLWKLLTQAAAEFDVDNVELSFNGRDKDSVLRWANGQDRKRHDEAQPRERRSQRFDFPDDLGCLNLDYETSRDEEFELERYQRLQMISHAVEKRLAALVNVSGEQN